MMPQTQTSRPPPPRAEPEPLLCAICRFNARADGWKIGPVVHCAGPRPHVFGNWVTNVHHGRQRVRCPKCQRVLGCDGCIVDATDMDRVTCMACEVTASGDRRATLAGVQQVFAAIFATLNRREAQ